MAERRERRWLAFARLLREARERQGYTPSEAARRAGVGVPYWRHLEHGTHRPSAETLPRIVRAVEGDHGLFARALGYLPAELPDGQTVTVETIEQAAWLRQFAATFSADELGLLYEFARQWQPRALAAEPLRRPA